MEEIDTYKKKNTELEESLYQFIYLSANYKYKFQNHRHYYYF